MNKNNKWKIGLLFLSVLVLTGCTKSFATVQDKSNVLVNYEQSASSSDATKTNLDVIIDTVEDAGYHAPSEKFFNYIETKVAEDVKANFYGRTITINGTEKSYNDLSTDELLTDTATRDVFVKTNEYALVKYAYAKAETTDDTWVNYDKWLDEAPNEGLTLEDIGSTYYHTYMKSTFNTYVSSVTSFITPVDMDMNGIQIEGKSWGDAFSYGLIEGLLVWPIAALVYYLSIAFQAMGGFGCVLAIFIVTVIVRGILLLLTFKQTASQQRMNEIQPELAKIQAKYPNADTNEYEKQQMGQEQMALYKKYNINPFGMLIVMIFQFPIFIAVWGAMQGSSILKTGTLFGLSLAASTGGSFIPWAGTSSIIALIIFILMALMQAASMLIPQYLQKKRTKNVAKMGKNPSAEKSASTMKMMNWVMLIMIIFMGYQLPVAMAIYWFISALISLVQSLIMTKISQNHTNDKKKGFTSYRTK